MKNVVPLLILLCVGAYVHAQKIVTIQASQHSFPLPEVICIDQQDDWLVGKAAELLREDMRRVTGREVKVVYGFPGEGELRRKDGDSGGGLLASDTLNRKYSVSSQKAHPVILIGTLQSSLIKELHVDTTGLTGKWEAFRITVAAGRVIIIGSDKRGAAYGALELSRQLGVSPWYWWADVPVIKKKKVFIQEGRYDFGPPSVQYRGIFINDEAPAFSGWTHEKFGGFNHLVYEKVFELLLRLRGNYLWPAMWGNAFNTDDTSNPVLADKWGIVMGTSHHEPMLRAQQEWKKYGRGAWDYVSNDSILRAFWRKGIVNMGGHESIVTVGMRGDGDMPMSNETATDLLERIVKDQREIISGVTGKPASETPQMWALYKEVQDYYDKGMRVPDDVTLLLCDDNWGNIRRLPVRVVGVVVGKGSGVVADEVVGKGEPAEKNAPVVKTKFANQGTGAYTEANKENVAKRKGGYGIYYHFDYVGDPRNYKWINTNNLARVWEQLHMAKMYGADKVWIVNVGDLKPMELPISFFMDYAWSAGDTMRDWYGEFAEENFAGGGVEKRHIERKNVKGKNVEGRNVDDKNIERKNVKGKNVKYRNVDDNTVERKNAKGKNAKYRNIDNNTVERKNAKGKNVKYRNIDNKNIERKNAKGKNVKYRNVDDKTVERKNAKGKNVKYRNIDNKNIERKNAKGKNVKYRNVDDKTVERKNAKGKNVKHRNVDDKNVSTGRLAKRNIEYTKIGTYLRQYSEMAARRKPELLDEYSYPLEQYKEIVSEWATLAKKVHLHHPSDAYFQLVQYPVEAMYNLHRLYYAVALYKTDKARNKFYADSARTYYKRDSLLTIAYHKMGNGKWNHMMDQTHIGYTGWQQPQVNKMPDLSGPYQPPVVLPKIYKRIYATDYVAKQGEWQILKGIGKFGDGITSFTVDNHDDGSAAKIKLKTNNDSGYKANPSLHYEFQASGDHNIYLNFSPTLNFPHEKGLAIAISIDGEKEIEMTINGNDDDKKVWEQWVANNIIQIKLKRTLKPGMHELVYSQRSPGIIFQSIELEKN